MRRGKYITLLQNRFLCVMMSEHTLSIKEYEVVIPYKPCTTGLWLQLVAVKALALIAVLVICGSINLQIQGKPVPDFFPWSGMTATATLAIVAKPDRKRPTLG
jgi:hypothetical protein